MQIWRGSRLWCRVLCRRNLFSKIVKHGSQAGVRWRIIEIRDSGLRVVVVESGVSEKKCQWSARGYSDNSFQDVKEMCRRGRRIDYISVGHWKIVISMTVSLSDWNESWNDFTTVSRVICLDSKISTCSTCCRRSVHDSQISSRQESLPAESECQDVSDFKTRPCCFCYVSFSCCDCKWVKLGDAEEQRLQYCVFLALLIGIRDGVNFDTLEYFHLYFFSE